MMPTPSNGAPIMLPEPRTGAVPASAFAYPPPAIIDPGYTGSLRIHSGLVKVIMEYCMPAGSIPMPP